LSGDSDGSDDDDGEKPLDPTEKRLSDALAAGDNPFAREAPVVAAIVGLVCLAGLIAVPLTISLSRTLAGLFANAATLRIETPSDVLALGGTLVAAVGGPLLPVLLIFVAAGIIASIAQNEPRFIGSRIAPKMSHVSPVAGLKRIFGSFGLMEFARALVKLLIASVVLGSVLHGARQEIALTMTSDPAASLSTLQDVSFRISSVILTAAGLLLVFDLIWSRHSWAGRLRMSHQEMKDEMKESDGDPHFKAKRLAMQRQRAKRMIAEVPKASVIITNPTHVAVALRYDASGAGVPQVVAKGLDHIAETIKAVAREHNVPMVEDVPLARALHRGVEVGQYIPREFFEAVARIIHIVTHRARRRSDAAV
jgi:flagellar biosynthesis protein FlhB